MEVKKYLVISVLLPTILAGCTVVPGSHLSVDNKNIIQADSNDQNDNTTEQVNIYPLDAHSVSRYNSAIDVRSRANAELDSQIETYEY